MKSNMQRTNTQAGFTLIELMITLVVGAILLVVAVPSFLNFQKDNRRITQLNELVSGLNLARSEATKSNATVGLLPQFGRRNMFRGYLRQWLDCISQYRRRQPAGSRCR